MTISINILGPFVIKANGHPVKLPKKGLALLGYLAVHKSREVTRERLADLLWPYQATEQARHSLRNCLLEVKHRLGPGVVIADFQTCRLAAPTDIDGFEELAASQDSEDRRCVGERYRGELLEDLWIDSEPWQEWLSAQRDLTRGLAMQALFRLAKTECAAGHHATAIAAVRRVIQLEPFCEAAHRLLMHALAAAGRSPEALRHYRDLEVLLKGELSIRPDGETLALRDRIRDSHKASARQEEPEAQPDVPPTIQLAPAAAALPDMRPLRPQLLAVAETTATVTDALRGYDLQALKNLRPKLQAVVTAALLLKRAIEALLDRRESPALEPPGGLVAMADNQDYRPPQSPFI